MRLHATIAFLTLLLLTASCFEKGSGTGTRATRPNFDTKGDIFIPGEKNKPGGDKDPKGNNPNEDPIMDPEASQLLADCFGIPKEEVEPVVGWTDATAAREAAKGLCDQLDTVNYKQGTIIDDADAVVLTD